jgi:asparagine synthase (glutamine-hydrolysing)
MCGIAGIVNLDKKPVNEKVLWEMTDAMAHRGPDGRGIYRDGPVGFGHRRLAVIDLSERACQPMKTEDGEFAITYNGEIYNFRELRNRLEKDGMRFRSDSDTEVVLKYYANCGTSCLNLFNGMFAFAVLDRKNKVLTLARDRYGIKPLYYWQQGGTFLFASEIKAFLKHPDFKAELDLETLLEYFTFQNTFSYKTLFRQVRLLPPGHFMQVPFGEDIAADTKQYWDFQFEEDEKIKHEEECSEELDKLFKEAVKRQLVSDVELGSYLSGGIDSGSVVAIASQCFKDLKTFCVGFDLSSASGLEISFDERKKAERISNIYQTEHYEMVLKSGDMKRCLPQLVWALEDLRLGQSYPNFYASKLASRFVKVCLSGAGGDELFAGYPWRYYKASRSKNFEEYIDGYYRYWQRLVDNRTLKELFSLVEEKVSGVWTEDIFTNVFENNKLIPKSPQDYINKSLYFEAKTFLHGLFIVEDKLSMAHGLEVRTPLLDNNLVDFAMKVPVRFKLKNIDHILQIDEDELAKEERYFAKTRDGKIISRKVLGKYVGNGIANQHKQGFSGPDASWFKGESINYVKDLVFNNNARIYEFIDKRTVQKLINEHLDGKVNRRLFVWSILSFEWWLRKFIF